MEEENNQLVLLTLDLGIPNLWENALVKEFPETRFIIQNAYPWGNNTFSGLLKINNGNVLDVQNFLRKYPYITLEVFHEETNLCSYSHSNSSLAKVIKITNCVLSWPIQLREDSKRIKIILKEGEVNQLINMMEKKKIKILSFSKVKIDFKLEETLTPKQKEILKPSLKLGYYEFPKRINLNSLAEKLNISPSTLCVHLQKIESRILNLDYSELFFRGF